MLERAACAAILLDDCTHRACSLCLCVAGADSSAGSQFLWCHSPTVSAMRKAEHAPSRKPLAVNIGLLDRRFAQRLAAYGPINVLVSTIKLAAVLGDG